MPKPSASLSPIHGEDEGSSGGSWDMPPTERSSTLSAALSDDSSPNDSPAARKVVIEDVDNDLEIVTAQ